MSTLSMPKTAPRTPQGRVPTAEEIQKIQSMLDQIDLESYWQRVTEKSAKEIEAYRVASAKYLSSTARRVLI